MCYSIYRKSIITYPVEQFLAINYNVLMKAAECNKIVSSYLAWLRKGMSVSEMDSGSCIIDTPFLDRRNDVLRVVAEKRDGQVCLHDRGDTLNELTMYIDLKSPDQQGVLEVILNCSGVNRENDRLYTVVPEKETGHGLHSLIQAMLSVEDMYLMARPQRGKSVFSKSVLNYFESKSVMFTPQVSIKGRSGFYHAIDYVVPRTNNAPERIIKAINAPNKNTISNYLFILEDSRKARERESISMALLNDTQREIKKEVIEALESYKVVPAYWSKKEDLIKQLPLPA